MAPGILDIERITSSLRTQRVGRQLVYIETVGSTNDEAWARLGGAASDGLVVLAEHQTRGRGRLGRTWHDARGASLLCSVLLVEGGETLSPARLAMAVPVAAADAIRETTGLSPALKWPNDLLLGGRKVGGILVESRRTAGGAAYVVGIGINCLQHAGHFPGDLSSDATSLDLHSPAAVDRTALAIALLSEFDRRLTCPTAGDEDELRRRWLANATPPGSRVTLRRDGRVFTGTIVDLDPTAALVVQLDEGGVRLFSAADTTAAGEPSAWRRPAE